MTADLTFDVVDAAGQAFPVLVEQLPLGIVGLGEGGVDDGEALMEVCAFLLQACLDGFGVGVGESLVEVG